MASYIGASAEQEDADPILMAFAAEATKGDPASPEARELVEEARRVAHNYASSGTSRFSSRWRTLNPIVYTLIGAGTIGLAWLIVALA